MDALELLKRDHQKVKALFEKAEATEIAKQQKRIFDQIKIELETHARIEERPPSISECAKRVSLKT